MNETKELRFGELVYYRCSRTYGTAPCSAEVGVTGDFKCANTENTCQDPSNFLASEEQTIIRWAKPTADLPIEIDAIPCISGIERRPQQIDPGESLGVRESVTINMGNFKHNMSGIDPYFQERGFNTYNSGTFWGKFSAIFGDIEGLEFRTVDGYVGQTLDEMRRRHYVVSSTKGPDSNGSFSFTVKDALMLLNATKAQWPLPSDGTLLAGIDDVETTITLTPAGIGDLKYPSSGIASMGDEIDAYTRSGDIVTLTARGLYGSEPDDHDEGETFQICEEFDAQTPAQIYRDLIQDATEVSSDYVDFDSWETEVDDFLGRLYSALIPRPTPVKTLLEDLAREAGLTVYTNLETKKIVLRVLRQQSNVLDITDDFSIAGKIAKKELVSKKVSDVWVSFGRKNPLEKMDEQKNYAVVYAGRTENQIVALKNAPSSIREVKSRWITTDNFAAAQSLADRIIARYELTPWQVGLKIPSTYEINLADQFSLQSRVFENLQGGNGEAFDYQVTSIDYAEGMRSIVAEQVRFGVIPPSDPELRIVPIAADVLDVTLRDLHDSIYSEAESGQTVRLVINGLFKIGSSTQGGIALNIGPWPEGVIIQIDGTGRIQGPGGNGGTSSSRDGEDGGTALYTRHPVEIIGNIEIYGPGGGGGYGQRNSNSWVGGGGAGYLPGNLATTEVGGSAIANAGDGGDPGEDGEGGLVEFTLGPEPVAEFTLGGDAGPAIDGISYVTITGTPDIKGSQIN